MWLKRIAAVLVLLLLLYLALAYYFSTLVITPVRNNDAEVRTKLLERGGVDIDTFRQKLPVGEDFTTNSKDGTMIVGTYFAQDTSRCAFVISHGYNGSRLSMSKYGHFLYDCGCDVVLYDHRAHGKSGGEYGTGGGLEAQDLLAVTRWLKDQTGLTGDQIGWMGESWGGSTVLQAGADREDVAFIIAESSFQDWDSAVFERAKIWYGSWIAIMRPAVWAIVALRTGVDYSEVSPLLKAKDIAEPVLVLHSRADTETNPVQSDNIAAALPADHSRLHNLDWGARHGNNVFVRPQEYQALLFDFIHDFAPEWDAYLKCE